jgi:NACHT domain
MEDSYRWILENSNLQQWLSGQQSRLLWIKGDPGKGKTMLLCGIIDELNKSVAKTDLLSYFFCQATDLRINHATAVLRGWIYVLVKQQPSLVSHVYKKYDHAGKTLFEDANAWIALADILTNILQDPSLNNAYIIVDALDECLADLPKLLAFIVKTSSLSPRVKWIVSSRNWPMIAKDLDTVAQKVMLSLELNKESVSAAVETYVQFKVDWLARRNKYSNRVRDAVQQYLSLNANGTFLWVALVCQELADVYEWDAEEVLKAFPPGLGLLYKRMLDQLGGSKYAKLCRSILAIVSIIRRPITLDELVSLVDMPPRSSGNCQVLAEIVGLCGSFLKLRERIVFFVHQSAREFLTERAQNEIYPSGMEYVHHTIFSRSLQVMSRTLRRDIYGLRALGYPSNQVECPDPDPLAASRYACVFWVDHLCDWFSRSCADHDGDLREGGTVEVFIREKYLYWLEALSLCRSMSEGVVSIGNLEALLQVNHSVPFITFANDV